MPYVWLPPEQDQQVLKLWPHQALHTRGLTVFLGVTAVGLGLPLLVALSTMAFWGLLPFVLFAFGVITYSLLRDRRVTETLSITADLAHLTRLGPGAQRAEWQANPYWSDARLYEEGGPLPAYLTLRGGGREVEIGAFLSESERRALYPELRAALRSSQKSLSPSAP